MVKKPQENQIKYYINEIVIMAPNKKIIKCTPKKNKKIFDLTIGGFGLTGIILSAKIKLKKIHFIYRSKNFKISILQPIFLSFLEIIQINLNIM